MKKPIEEILDRETWKSHGAVSTPAAIVDFMIGLARIKSWSGLEILEPGAGGCEFLARIRQKYPDNHFTGVEINQQIFKISSSANKNFELVQSDFLLWGTAKKFDLVIGNPPYGIIGDKSHYPIHVLKKQKQIYRDKLQTWFGKYNIYGAFIEKSVSLLKEGGKMLLIVPATFMILDDFKLLRKFLAESGRLKIYYLGPGKFAQRVVSTAVLVLVKGGKGIELYECGPRGKITRDFAKKEYSGDMIRFKSAKTSRFEKGKIALGEIFGIHFAARSPEIKNHPLTKTSPGKGLAPVLTGRNLRPGWIDYAKCFSGYFFPQASTSSLREFYGKKHIVVGHTKGGRVVAAIDDRGYPWREEMHLTAKNLGIDLEEVVTYMNSEEVQNYMRTLYKEITPHLTITQLKLLPMPRSLGGKGR